MRIALVLPNCEWPPSRILGQLVNDGSWPRMVVRSSCNAELGGMAASLDTISPHLVAKRHHAVPIRFDLRQMEGNISVEPLEEREAIANQDRQNRVAHF